MTARVEIKSTSRVVESPAGTFTHTAGGIATAWTIVPANLVGAIVPDFAALDNVAITTDLDDWNPVNLATTQGYNATVTGNHQITGLVSMGVQQTIWLVNLGADHIKLKQENLSSIAVNRFSLPDSSDYDLKENSIAILTFNPLIMRWMVVSEAKP